MATEDFTTYTEVDPDTVITVIAAKVSWDDLDPRDVESLVYDDKGAGHFSGDFTHLFEIDLSGFSSDNQLVGYWVLANMVGDLFDMAGASADGHCFYLYTTGDLHSLRLGAIENGAFNVDEWDSAAQATTYYITLDRDDDAGANSTGQLTAYIRTSSHEGDLQDTLVQDCAAGEQNDFRYIYALSTFDNNDNKGTIDGFTENLDLQEVAGPTPKAVAGSMGRMAATLSRKLSAKRSVSGAI